MKLYRLFFAVFFVFATACRAGDALVEDNFDKLDLGALPAGWSATKQEVSLIEVDGRGKVLRIRQEGQGRSTFTINLDRQVVAGGTVSAKVRVKLTKPYTPDIEKKAYIFVGFTINTGTGTQMLSSTIPSNLPDWYEVSPSHPIPADVQGVAVVLGITGLAGDVCFDDLIITLTGKALPKQEAGPVAGPAPPTGNKNADTVANATPEQRNKLGGLPQKSLEADGFLFNATAFVSGQNAVKSGMKKHAYAQAGPGAPLANITAKSIANWALLSAEAKTVQGGTTEKLAVVLPTFLTTHKPEVVFLIAGAKTERTPAVERSEWEDLASLCYRYGTIPVIVVPAEEEQRKAMLEAAQAVKCAVLDQREPLDRRMSQLLALIEEHIFERKPPVKELDE